MSEVIAIAMQKGGVGKTTTTVNLAAALAELGQRVLVVDLDPQGNLTEHLGRQPEKISPTIYNVLRDEIEKGENSVQSAIHPTSEGFDLLPAQPELSLIDLALINTLSRERVFETVLAPIRDNYDYILVDCNPSLGLLVVNALTSADSVIIPIQTEYLAARGANMILSTIETIKRKRLNPHLRVSGIILTMADTRTLITRDVLEAVQAQLGDDHRIFTALVKRSVRFAESAVAGQSILKYDTSSQGAAAYRDIAKELIHGPQTS